MNWYKKANEKASQEDIRDLKQLVQKIMRGERNWTEEDLQVQQNFPELLEEMLRENYELV